MVIKCFNLVCHLNTLAIVIICVCCKIQNKHHVAILLKVNLQSQLIVVSVLIIFEEQPFAYNNFELPSSFLKSLILQCLLEAQWSWRVNYHSLAIMIVQLLGKQNL